MFRKPPSRVQFFVPPRRPGREVRKARRLQAFDSKHMYVGHSEAMLRVLQSFGVPEADLDDALQEVFLVAHRRRDEFQGDSEVSTWLYGIARRVASDKRRQHRRLNETDMEAAPEGMISGEHIIRRVAATQTREILERLVAELDPEKRFVYQLCDLQSMDVQTVAAWAGIPVQTAFSRLYKAREIIEKRLKLALKHGER